MVNLIIKIRYVQVKDADGPAEDVQVLSDERVLEHSGKRNKSIPEQKFP